MATEIAKVNKENDLSASSPKKATDSTDSTAIVENSSDQVSVKTQVDESTEGKEEVTDVQKKMKRAERFGMPVKLSEEEKRNTRAERFGSVANSNETGAVKGSEDQKRKARAERFGISVEAVTDEESKKKARIAKFGAAPKVDGVEDDKRKARALRFSQPSNGAGSNLIDKAEPKMKTAVEGNLGGAA